MPSVVEIGVARPSAHGQAYKRTEIALFSIKAICGTGPSKYQPNAVNADNVTIVGTKTFAKRSTSFDMDVPELLDLATSFNTRDRCPSLPLQVA